MNTTARLGLIFEDNGARVVMPLSVMTAFIAIVGFIFPSGMGVALAFIGAAAGLMASLTWLHLQVVGMVVIAKIVTDTFLYFYNGGQNHDYYE